MSVARIRIEGSFRVAYGTKNGAGAAANADAPPTVAVYEQGVAMAYAPVVANLAVGLYSVLFDCTAANGFEVGKDYTAAITTVIGAVTTRTPIASVLIDRFDLTSLLDAIIEGPAQYDGLGEPQPVGDGNDYNISIARALRELIAYCGNNWTGGDGPQAILKSRVGGRNRSVMSLNNGNRTITSRDGS